MYLLTGRFSMNPGQVGTYLAMGSLSYFLCCNLYHRFGTAVSPARIIPTAVAVVFLSSLALNRDISIFNLSWMSGNLLGPPVSGGLSFLAANLGYALVFGILVLVVRREIRLPGGEIQGSGETAKGRPLPKAPLSSVILTASGSFWPRLC